MSKKFKKPLFLISFFISGAILSFYLPFNEKLWLLFLVLSVILVVFKRFIILALLLSAFVGIVYTQIFINKTHINVAPGCFTGTIVSIPKDTANGQQAAFETSGGIRFVVESDEESIGYRDLINVCFEGSNQKEMGGGYGQYLLSRYQSKTVIHNPKIELIDQNSFLTSFFGVKGRISRILKKIYIGDKGTLAIGLILGGSQDFSDGFKEAMKASGTTHLVAVSGYNVSIITIVLFGLIRSLFSRRVALTSSFVVLVGFCVITGASASVVRAAVMGGLYLISKALGRKVPPLHLLAVAAFLMILQNPFSVFDVGFQLSFAATFGLILSLEIFDYFSSKRPLNAVLAIIPETLIASIFTWPILIYQFKQASIISALPNALILPFVPLGMLAVVIAIIAGLINIYAGIFAGFLGEILLRYFIFIIKYFGSLSFAKVSLVSFPFYLVVISYVVIISLISFLSKKINAKRLSEDI